MILSAKWAACEYYEENVIKMLYKTAIFFRRISFPNVNDENHLLQFDDFI